MITGVTKKITAILAKNFYKLGIFHLLFLIALSKVSSACSM